MLTPVKPKRQAPKGLATPAFRAPLVAIERVLGASVKEIASRYAISTDTVLHDLERAEKDNFYAHFERLVLNQLVPRALAVYQGKLEEGDLAAARDVLFGMGVLRRDPESRSGGDVIESLHMYRVRRAGIERQDLPCLPQTMTLPPDSPSPSG